jgi:type I restriction enzyme M protein
VLATSGEDAFEAVFSVAAARLQAPHDLPLRTAVSEVSNREPSLGIDPLAKAPDALLARVDELLRPVLDEAGALDAVFELLVPRLAKSDKGQFFTPRHVVDFVLELLAPRKGEVLVDPACGSGAFLSAARKAGAEAHGGDIDARAVRVARLLALAEGGRPEHVRLGDSLRGSTFPLADVVATNPPFAGLAPSEGFSLGHLLKRPERDALFLERSLAMLRPGGRLGIVLPYNKAAGSAFAPLRRWLLEQARVYAICGLARETFLPHTSQRTFVLLARKRAQQQQQHGRCAFERVENEKTIFVVSERGGKDAAGELLRATDGRVDHDLTESASAIRAFLAEEERT